MCTVVLKHTRLLKEFRASRRLEIYKIIILDSEKAMKSFRSQLEEAPTVQRLNFVLQNKKIIAVS